MPRGPTLTLPFPTKPLPETQSCISRPPSRGPASLRWKVSPQGLSLGPQACGGVSPMGSIARLALQGVQRQAAPDRQHPPPPRVTKTANLGFHFSLLAATFSAFSGTLGQPTCSALLCLLSGPHSALGVSPTLAGLRALRPVTPLHGCPVPSPPTQEAPLFMTHPHGVRSPTAVGC